MPEQGTFGDKLLSAIGWAGKHGRRARLHSVVDDAIKRHGVGDGAQRAIMDAIDDDPALMVEMLDEIQFRKPLVKRFMQKRIAALRNMGQTIKTPPKGGDRAGQRLGDTHADPARPAEQNAAQAARGGQSISDTHRCGAPATNTGAAGKDGMGQVVRDTHLPAAHPSTQQPKSPQHRTALLAARNKTARSVLAQASMVSGKPYGDLTKRDLQDEVRRADHRGQFARRVLAEAEFPDNTTPLKRVLSDKDADALWTKAWEAVTHAA